MDKLKKADELLNNGAKLFGQNNFFGSIKLFNKAIRLNPKFSTAYYNLALAHQRLGNYKMSIKYFLKTIILNPDDSETNNLIAENYYRLGEFKKALKFRPNYPESLTNLGAIYARNGKLKDALALYQKSLSLNENYSTTYVFLGNVLLAQGNLDDAIMCYNMAIEKDNKNSEAFNDLGAAYARQQKYGNAVDAFKKALKLNKNSEQIIGNLAMAYSSAKKNIKALKYFKMAVKIYPNNGMFLANLLFQMMENADWEGIENIKNRLDKISKKEIELGIRPGEDPFINVIRKDNPVNNLEVAKLWSRNIEDGISRKKKFLFKKNKTGKINIGYFSAHFHNHPTSQLISKLLKLHDKNKFNIFIYSAGPNDGSSYYKKIFSSGVAFNDLFNVSFSDSASKIYDDKIDILVDLDGHTDNNKLQIFALRPAPIQITYLGFPGTTGANFIDYIIADKTVIPTGEQIYYSERVVYLPNSYQVNDNSQAISSIKYERKDFGLPQKSFVFASFNSIYKIEPQVFTYWMKILKRVPGSILWLLKTNSKTETNLKAEAQKRGVKPNRLIFSPRLPKDKHLKRLSLADLSLDTFICNGHTSTSDALWAGLPVITQKGNHFASRVSSSLLTALGLDNLITHSPEEYINLAISLAQKPSVLSKIRKSLALNRISYPLFNTENFTLDLEKLYIDILKQKEKENSSMNTKSLQHKK